MIKIKRNNSGTHKLQLLPSVEHRHHTIFIPGRRQSKMLILSKSVDQKQVGTLGICGPNGNENTVASDFSSVFVDC